MMLGNVSLILRVVVTLRAIETSQNTFTVLSLGTVIFLRLLFSLKPKEMAKMRLLAIYGYN